MFGYGSFDMAHAILCGTQVVTHIKPRWYGTSRGSGLPHVVALALEHEAFMVLGLLFMHIIIVDV